MCLKPRCTCTELRNICGVVKIADFGLARLVDNAVETVPGSAPPIVGTPEYMAPEQARNPEQADTVLTCIRSAVPSTSF